MNILSTQIESQSEGFKKNKEHNLNLLNDLKERLERVKKAGGEKSVERHRSREKMLPRERIEMILDEGSPFLELSALAADDLYEKEGPVPSAGMVTGIGRVHGVECMFVANDATVKGGTY
ncbi:MAG: methylcrotonoyl-CoA carboxylase, partial [Halobacteriovoraceae bacterium]|nr:methylcrotonoyl-CoA carboxylase [Halobacteriovoraceae bacterium]